MPEVEEQLRRYGEAVERHLLGAGRPTIPRSKPWPTWPAFAASTAAAAALVLALLLAGGPERERVTTERPAPPGGDESDGVFSSPTGVVLLFSDGIDGVTAIDLDRRIAGRRVLQGERAGDQTFRATLTDGHLVVGWGEVWAVPLDGGPATKIADATIYLPAAEPGEVWTITWAGGRIGQGGASLARVALDGAVVLGPLPFDTDAVRPVLGVPGGLAVESPEGLAIWDADTATVGPVLGPGPVEALASDGRRVVWCTAACAEVHVAGLAAPGPATAPSISLTHQKLAVQPTGDGAAAVLRPSAGGASIVLVDLSTGEERVVASGLSPYGSLQWTPDGSQLFYADNSYRQPSTRIGRYSVVDATWELRSVPVGDGLAAIVLTPDQSAMLLEGDVGEPAQCPGAGGSYPSGRLGACSFTFDDDTAPASCAAAGEATVVVPDVVGLELGAAIDALNREGFVVVGPGVPDGDPEDPGAIVLQQEPPAGRSVPAGACIGFRTGGG